MKAVFPKNIQKGLLSGLNISIGPLSISIIQLFILAIGIAIALVVFSKVSGSSKVIATFFAILIFLFFVLIAFFKVSELNIVAFLAKFIQNHFFDTTEKYQTNFAKTSQTDIAIEKFKIQNTKQKIDYKTKLELNNFDKIDTAGLLGK
ncbi:hypothetical protein BSK20_00675 [SR1 bacterium human oral taxon HOT-345]|nr:hypothetical protein BSK20_00675 [SR1 bacterium human oral taxon HOT-345]